MGTNKTLERQFQKHVREMYAGFSTQLHPGLGSDVGIPDLILGASSGLLMTEIKIGSIDSDNILWCSNIRPSQISYHRKLSEAGFPSIFLVGVQSGKTWRTFAFNAVLAPQYDLSGFKVKIDCFELPCHDLASEIDEFIFREFGA